jgi:type I restriction enzyme S subunit
MTLPLDWSVVTLDQVLAQLPSGSKVQQGWSPQCEKVPASDGEWGVLKTTAIQAGAFIDEHHKRLPDDLEPRAGLEVHAGDLLLTNAGPRARCAVTCLVRTTRSRLMLSGKIYRFRTDESRMDPRFLEYFLLSPATQNLLDQMKTGISDSGLNLTRARFLNLPVVVPPMLEQRRIVDLLEDHLSRLDAATDQITTADHRATRWLDVTLERATSGDWPTTNVGSLAIVGSGATPLKSRTAYYEGGAIPWVTSGALHSAVVREPTTFVTELAVTETALRLWPAGTLLVAMYGEGKTRGRCSELAFSATTNQACAAISLHTDNAELQPWVKLVLRSKYQRMRRMAAGGVQPNLSLGLVKAIQIPLPPEPVRRQLLSKMDEADVAAARVRSSTQIAAARGATLRRSLLSAAFGGYL